MNDYNDAIKKLINFSKYYLGQEVNTDIGKGIIVELTMPRNGLYISPEKTSIVVWFGTAKDNGWVNKLYSIQELDKYNEN